MGRDPEEERLIMNPVRAALPPTVGREPLKIPHHSAPALRALDEHSPPPPSSNWAPGKRSFCATISPGHDQLPAHDQPPQPPPGTRGLAKTCGAARGPGMAAFLNVGPDKRGSGQPLDLHAQKKTLFPKEEEGGEGPGAENTGGARSHGGSIGSHLRSGLSLLMRGLRQAETEERNETSDAKLGGEGNSSGPMRTRGPEGAASQSGSEKQAQPHGDASSASSSSWVSSMETASDVSVSDNSAARPRQVGVARRRPAAAAGAPDATAAQLREEPRGRPSPPQCACLT